MVSAAMVATAAAAQPKIATGTQLPRSGPASRAAMDGAKPPRAKPNWVPMATPDIRTLVSNCSLNRANADPAVGRVDDAGEQDADDEDQREVPWLTAQMNGQIRAAEPSAPMTKTGLRPIRSPTAAHAGIVPRATTLAMMIIHSRLVRDRPTVLAP